MNEMNENQQPVSEDRFTPPPRKRPSKAVRKQRVMRMVLRGLMVFLTVILMVLSAAWLLLDTVFNGPSVTARDVLTRSLSFSSGTYWIPSVFLGEELANQIIQNNPELELPNDRSEIVIDSSGALNGDNDEWTDYPDGIYIETVKASTYTAHVMVIRDPSTVYVATSTEHYSTSIPGMRLNHVIEREGAIAGINAGAFLDNGTADPIVGSIPYGLVVSEGEVVWDDGRSQNGFVGFTEDNVMVVSKTISATQAREWKIRDGCCFGPVLIMDGVINQAAYDNDAGWNPRTAIGQRSDGAVIMVVIDGRQASGIGGSYADLIDIMIEYEAVNACNLDGGSSSIMYYRDTYGIYGQTGALHMVNSYSLLQEEPRVMPTFILVRPSSED